MWQKELLCFLCGCLAMYVVSINMFRMYLKAMSTKFQAKEAQLKKQKTDIAERTQALQTIIHRVYHEGPMPISKRIIGLARISFPSLKTLKEYLTLLTRPNHHEYAKLALKEFSVIEDYFNKSKNEAEEMDEYLKQSVKRFEHLQ
jgi:hypothetical protein